MVSESWNCPLPLRDYPTITMAHGGGGKLSAELIEHLFLPAFCNDILAALADSAILEAGSGQLAVTTDSYVVQPLFFPGGCIGDLAINGTVNDLAMSGAEPLAMTAAFILEEGFEIAALARIVEAMATAARIAGAHIVAGDLKVIERSRGDGCYLCTTGIGRRHHGIRIAPNLAQPGDRVLLSGTLGDHGIAVLSRREGLAFDTIIESDTAPLNGLVRNMLEVTSEIHCLRDPTRGGLAATLNELAGLSNVGIVIDEVAIPVNPGVRAACEMLGLDPLHVANEGKLAAIVPEVFAESVLAAMRSHPSGTNAAMIGRVTAEHTGLVVARSVLGGLRIVPRPLGEQLPRIC